MAKDTRDYNAVRVLGLTEDSDLVDVRVSSSPATSALLDLLSPCVTASDELKVKVSGDITIESVEVDRVQLVDANGNKPIYTASGAIQTAVFDGDNEALGSTSDTDSDTTVIGRLQKLITDLGTLADSKTLSDIVTSLAAVETAIETAEYGGKIVSQMQTASMSVIDTWSEAKGAATALTGPKIIKIRNVDADVSFYVSTDSGSVYGDLVTPGEIWQTVIADAVDVYVKGIGTVTGSALVTEAK